MKRAYIIPINRCSAVPDLCESCKHLRIPFEGPTFRCAQNSWNPIMIRLNDGKCSYYE